MEDNTDAEGYGVLALVLGDFHIPHRTSEIPPKYKEILSPNQFAYVLCTGIQGNIFRQSWQQRDARLDQNPRPIYPYSKGRLRIRHVGVPGGKGIVYRKHRLSKSRARRSGWSTGIRLFLGETKRLSIIRRGSWMSTWSSLDILMRWNSPSWEKHTLSIRDRWLEPSVH